MVNEHDELALRVFDAMGKVSTCWEDLPGAGKFKANEALAITNELLAYLRARERRAVELAISQKLQGL